VPTITRLRGRQHGLDVDLERAFALAGDRDHGHAVRDRRAELLGGAEQQQLGRALRHDPLRLADHHRLGAGAANPAVQLAIGGDDRART